MKELPTKLQEFIEATPWTFAKTYAKTWPHEYIVEEQVDGQLFAALALHIDTHGYDAFFYEHKQRYFDFDGRTYWHMDNIINRCLESETYERRKTNGKLPE